MRINSRSSARPGKVRKASNGGRSQALKRLFASYSGNLAGMLTASPVGPTPLTPERNDPAPLAKAFPHRVA
jgi:hypothetical protein